MERLLLPMPVRVYECTTTVLHSADSPDKYDTRDVDRLLKDDALVDSYLTWRHFVIDDALKMIDESFQWRKELGLNGRSLCCVHWNTQQSGC